MKDTYAQDVEKQNEKLRELLDETTKKLVDAEKTIYEFDYCPTFHINHNKRAKVLNYIHSPFIHQNLTSTYEVLTDWVSDDILTHVERSKNKPIKIRKPRQVSIIDLQCYFLGSLERTYHIWIYSPTAVKGKEKYGISVTTEIPNGIPDWDNEKVLLYESKVPSAKELRDNILEDLQDCQVLNKYVEDK